MAAVLLLLLLLWGMARLAATACEAGPAPSHHQPGVQGRRPARSHRERAGADHVVAPSALCLHDDARTTSVGVVATLVELITDFDCASVT
jgi:hypothetical protein